MELLSSMLRIIKDAYETDKQFKLLLEKLVFYINKGEGVLAKCQHERLQPKWAVEYLQNRLLDAREKRRQLEKLLSSSNDQRISIKDKLKLSLPFNNERSRIKQAIDNLKGACHDIQNFEFYQDPPSGKKHKLKIEDKQNKGDKNIKKGLCEKSKSKNIKEKCEMRPTITENNAMKLSKEDAASQLQPALRRQQQQEIASQPKIVTSVLPIEKKDQIEPSNQKVVLEYKRENRLYSKLDKKLVKVRGRSTGEKRGNGNRCWFERVPNPLSTLRMTISEGMPFI